ncbi:TolC family protein [Methylomonas sp. UP202]|uniref:TolC family protein n=1 Tax=Methylomonas sp. UP202 TaxID=3040943 RepID=UPI00247A87DC|nr:TolC family protein [Methylomonas sp. UP202]WGS85074.1 TolC family protein [Methylomonas sp. UP202]
MDHYLVFTVDMKTTKNTTTLAWHNDFCARQPSKRAQKHFALRTMLFAALTMSGLECIAEDTKAVPLPLFVNDADQSTSESVASRASKNSPVESTPDEAHELSLNAAIQLALEADPQIRAGVEAVRQAEADVVTADLPPNPSLSTSGSLMPLNRPFTVDRQGGPPQFDIGMSFPVDWFLFGKRAAAVMAAEKGVDVAAADFSELVRQRIAGTIAAFYDVLEAQSALALAREDFSNLSEVEKITANRVELGGVGTVELDRVRLSIFSSRREVRAREVALEGAFSRLRSFLGYTQAVPLKIDGSLDVPSPITPLDSLAIFAIAEDNRPDIQALKHQITQAEANIELAEVSAYPAITPKVGYTRQFQEKAIGYPDANSWGIGVDVTVPLFDRNQGNIAKARSAKVQSELNLSAQLVNLRAEIDQAIKAYESAYQVLISDDPGQLEAARNVRDKIRTAYELGGKTLMEVLDAQRTYRETYRLHIAGRSNYWHSLYALNAALGKQVLK